MKYKLYVIFITLSLGLSWLSAQDSTFVRYYYPTYQTNPNWYYFDPIDIKAANVFETYDGNFAMQTNGIYWVQYPDGYVQSPIITFNQNGEYLQTAFGPVNSENNLVDEKYTNIIKDGHGGYLATTNTYDLVRLAANFDFIEYLHLWFPSDTAFEPLEIIQEDDGFVAIGWIPGIFDVVCLKYDYDLNLLWIHTSNQSSGIMSNNRVISTSDGGYLFRWQNSPSNKYMKVNDQGDSLWCASVGAPHIDNIVENNNRYYGFYFHNVDIDNGLLEVYDFGIDFTAEHPEIPIISIPTNGLLWNDDHYSVRRTSDGGIVLVISTPNAEVFKFDSNFNLQWSSNALTDDRIGVGKQPIIELANGDFLYCARILLPNSSNTDKLALVRIDSLGQYVGVADEFENKPQPCSIIAYPNPFTSELTFKVRKNIPYKTAIMIYNIKGQLIKSIDVTSKEISWKPQDIPSGVYIINLIQNGKQIQSRKITYTK